MKMNVMSFENGFYERVQGTQGCIKVMNADYTKEVH